MKSAFRIAAVAFIAFMVIVLARFPATWAKPLLPENVSCDQIAGTLWSGTCLGLVARGAAAGDVKWDLHPWKLLTGKLSLALEWARGTANAKGEVELGLGGAIGVRNLVANLPLDANLLPWVPSSLRGSAGANLRSLQIKGRVITGIEGHIDAQGIALSGTNYGGYRITFPPVQGDAMPVGSMVDTGEGPLKLIGQVKLTAEPGFVVEGRVAAKPGAPPRLARQIEFLGSPDPEGMRPFSRADTY